MFWGILIRAVKEREREFCLFGGDEPAIQAVKGSMGNFSSFRLSEVSGFKFKLPRNPNLNRSSFLNFWIPAQFKFDLGFPWTCKIKGGRKCCRWRDFRGLGWPKTHSRMSKIRVAARPRKKCYRKRERSPHWHHGRLKGKWTLKSAGPIIKGWGVGFPLSPWGLVSPHARLWNTTTRT